MLKITPEQFAKLEHQRYERTLATINDQWVSVFDATRVDRRLSLTITALFEEFERDVR